MMPFLRMSFLLSLHMMYIVSITGFSPELKVYNDATNTSQTYNASDEHTHVTHPVDSASNLDVIFREGCHGNLTTFNSTITERKSTFPDLGPLPDVTKVNKSDNIELRCTTRGAMIKFRTVWHKTGSEISLSNKTALYLRNVTYTDTGSYVCFVHYQSCNANNISNTKNNLTKTTYVDVQGPPLFILPTEKKSYQVAEGQPIMFHITIASSPSPEQSLVLWKSDSNKSFRIGVDFNRKKAPLSEAKDISGEMPVYTAYVRLTNITSSWTGTYILYINNSRGYDTYEFSINVHYPPKVSIWQSRSLEIVGGGIGGLVFLAIVVGIIVMCHTRHKQKKVIQENIKELVEAKNKERKDALGVWDLGTRPESKFDFTNEQHRQLQSTNTFNDVEDAI
ncbi:uncharacterized protein LOC125678063 isoform X2 [Ostrea edulis]|uniref:uncharacterized protein LOC125678063 isoform X2 n=1 Tax=Ostrea edulis TaxID=37623 RepID=UPI0024AECC17|nr:uncharacterized protein LOC125678063 isoform X2 [Ostrea edulis]